VANKWLSSPGTAAEAYDGMVKSGISVKDLVDAGISQDAIDKALSIPTSEAQKQVNALTAKALTTTLSQNPTLASEIGARGTSAIYKQAQQFVENLQKDGLTDAERQQLQQVATQQGWGFADIRAAGIDPDILFKAPAAAAPVVPPPVVPPPVVPPPVVPPPVFRDPVPYTPVTVYDPEKFARENAGEDLYKKGEVALDTAFRESAPRTAVPGMPGAYEYTPAASLRPATGAGMSWTPPVVTSRPRSLLSPTLLSYTSPSQQFAQARATQDQALLGAFRESGLPQNASNFNTWRNRLRSGEFGSGAAFDPATFQSAFGSWASTQPPAGGATAQGSGLGSVGTGVTGYSEIAGGLQPVDLRTLPPTTLAQGGEVSSARRMLEQVKKPEGFAEGGMPTADPRPLDPRDPLYRTEERDRAAAAEMLAQQMLAIGNQPATAQLAAQREAVPKTESASMLQNIVSGASQIPASMYEYGKGIAQSERPLAAFGEDVSTLAGGMYEGLKQDPIGFGLDMAPIVGEIRSALEARELSNLANEADAAGDTALANNYRQLATMAAAGAFPFGGIGARGAKRAAMSNIVDVPPDSARAMLDELTPETGAVPEEGALTAAVTRPVEPMPVSESEEMLTQLDEIQAAPATPEARLTTQESRAINASVGRNPTKRQEAAEKARQFKQDYATEKGWTPIEITGIKYNKAKRPEILAKKISYNFEKPPAGLDQDQWATQLSDRLSSEVSNVVDRAQNGDAAALGILRQANWYRSMRDRLRSEFGGIGDVFADVLGTTSAQTGVEQNFKNASEILRRFSRGEFDNELTAYQRRLDQGLSVDGQELTALHKAGEFPLITNAAGSLFNSNSPASMGALLDMFRSVKQGSSPKTPNFTGNLIGLTNEATIDVWAARILRRLSGQDRIPPLAEKGVTGKHRAGSTLTQPVVGQEFGFGQDVFRRAADTINQSGTIKNVVPEMGNLGPDDLQAVAWFMEKERWTENGWTTKAGEGGSLDFEMSLAGAPSQERVYELRRAINAGFKPPAKRKTETDLQYEGRVEVARRQYDEAKARNQAELTIMEAPLQRYQLGVSGERPARTMSNYAQAELAAPLDDAVRDDPTVLTYNLANTYGSFMGQTERALNAEFVTRANFDPQALVRRLVEQGKDYDQDAVFFSKVVPSTTSRKASLPNRWRGPPNG
jgi:hypothetical protein